MKIIEESRSKKTFEKHLVSIIIPLFNAEKYISETIQSVINQSYLNWELIIVDDCSTDKSVDIVYDFEKIDSRVKLIKSNQNFGGPARPRNIGVENSQGEYIAFLDADDIWDIDKLQVQIASMIDNSYHFSSTNSNFIDKNSDIINSVKYKLLSIFKKNNFKETLCDLIKNRFIATSSVVVKREYIELFDEDIDLVSVEDLCLWLKLFNKDINYHYIDDKLLSYRVLDDSISSRTTPHRQSTKANICILKFILHNSRYDMLECFYAKIKAYRRINLLKRVLGKKV